MQSDYKIQQGDSSFLFRSNMPLGWETTTSVAVEIKNSSGDSLDTGNATIQAATTLSSAVLSGRREIVVAGGAYSEDDLLEINSSDAGAPEFIVVESFNSSTKTITLKERLKYSHSASADVYCRWLTYTFDASALDNLSQGTIEWVPATDDQSFVELFKILSQDFQADNISTLYRQRFPAYAELVDQVDGWETFVSGALNLIDGDLASYDRSISDQVSRSITNELIFAAISYMIVQGHLDTRAEEITIVKEAYETRLTRYRSMTIKTDVDQDGNIQEETDNQKANLPLPYRGI